MNKRAQITLFVVVAVIVIIIILMFFVLKPGTKTREKQEISLESYINSQLEITAKDAITVVSLQGGYYKKIPEYYLQYGTYVFPFWFYETKKYVPELSEIEKEIADYVDNFLPRRVDKSLFEEQGIKVEFGDPETSVKINQDSVIFSVDFPVTAKKDKEIRKIEKFGTRIPINFLDIYDIAREITDTYKEDGIECLDCVMDIADSHKEIYLNITYQTNEIIWYQLINKNYDLGYGPYTFIFLAKSKE